MTDSRVAVLVQSFLTDHKVKEVGFIKRIRDFGHRLRLRDRLHLHRKRDNRPLLSTTDRAGIMATPLPAAPDLDKLSQSQDWPTLPADDHRRQKLVTFISAKLDQAEQRGETGKAIEKTLREEVFRSVLKSATRDIAEQSGQIASRIEHEQIADKICDVQDKIDAQMQLFQERATFLLPKMSTKDLKRAGTNVWPMLCFQVLSGRKPRLTNAMVGMSLLYPLTDDLVDDPGLSKDAKAGFLARFNERVACGKGMPGDSTKEREIWAMFNLIEGDVSRFRFPLTYRSLSDLLLAQGDSRLQMGGPLFSRPVPNFDKVWEVTVRKGALSILSDALLLKGRLTEAEVSFAAHFGTLTQYLNDARGLEDDLRNGQYTPFNMALQKGPSQMDAAVGFALSHFFETFNSAIHLSIAGSDPTKVAFMGMMCSFPTFKLFEAIAVNQNRFTSEFLARIEQVSPLPLALIQRLWLLQYTENRDGEILPDIGSSKERHPSAC